MLKLVHSASEAQKYGKLLRMAGNQIEKALLDAGFKRSDEASTFNLFRLSWQDADVEILFIFNKERGAWELEARFDLFKFEPVSYLWEGFFQGSLISGKFTWCETCELDTPEDKKNQALQSFSEACTAFWTAFEIQPKQLKEVEWEMK